MQVICPHCLHQFDLATSPSDHTPVSTESLVLTRQALLRAAEALTDASSAASAVLRDAVRLLGGSR